VGDGESLFLSVERRSKEKKTRKAASFSLKRICEEDGSRCHSATSLRPLDSFTVISVSPENSGPGANNDTAFHPLDNLFYPQLCTKGILLMPTTTL